MSGSDDDIAPVIGVSSSEIRIPEHLRQIPKGEPPHREICLGLPYLHAVVQAGAVPLIIAPLRQDLIERILDTVDGICLSGGPDIDPKTYGQPAHEMLGPTEYATDTFEIALAKAADQRGIPILAICRGAQVLNVARGGTLYQHIPDAPGAGLEHRQKELGHTTTHDVDIVSDSLLRATIGVDSASVNSFHHQAVERLGGGLRASAHSKDGIIEGVEAVDRDFVLGVQWHAESLTDTPQHEALFRGLADAALRYRERRGKRSMRAV
ncbi:MAG: gamma-glutamyl-gamma-aminobutyrate hydrolase family protein [Solirubrobacterales bacterium]